MGKFVIKRSRSGYTYHFEGDDALIIGSSDHHKTLASAKIGIGSVKSIAALCRMDDTTAGKHKAVRNPKFVIYRDSNKKLRFGMKAKNGQQVLLSVPYKEMDDLLAAIEDIRTSASEAAIQE